MDWARARRRWRLVMIAIAAFFVVLVWSRPTLDVSGKVLSSLLFVAIAVGAYFNCTPRRQ
jgi:hypothetical protein